jgi:hypothetical protein
MMLFGVLIKSQLFISREMEFPIAMKGQIVKEKKWISGRLVLDYTAV